MQCSIQLHQRWSDLGSCFLVRRLGRGDVLGARGRRSEVIYVNAHKYALAAKNANISERPNGHALRPFQEDIQSSTNMQCAQSYLS